MKHVIIRETGSTRLLWESKHRAADVDEAIQKAINKHFGKNAFFFKNCSMPNSETTQYGQIFKHLRTGMNISLTDNIMIDVND